METGISFTTLLLGEISLVLLIALFFSIRYNLKQKALLKRLIEKYKEIKSEQKIAESEKAKFYADKKAKHQQSIAEYFELSLSDSLQRYEKNTGSHLPHLDSNHSFSARVAALRSLYLTAEKEVFEERGITHAGWGLFERKLADIVRWQDKKDTQRQEIKDNRLRLMQDRLDSLKGTHEKNTQLQEKVERLLKSEKNLKQYQLESQQTINNLQYMLEQLKQLSPTASPATAPSENSRIAIDMIRELKTYKTNFSAEIKEKMDNYMNMLEVELMKSDNYIGSLKKELKEAKIQATNYAIMLRDARIDEKGNSLNDGELSTALDDMATPSVQKSIIAEVKQLRENNRIQRDLIFKMEHEIQLLKNSVNPDDTIEIREEKAKEILRLERIVKECQGCIDTLESEVDHLYSQLQERMEFATEYMDKNDNEYTSEELTMLTKELEKTIAHYQQLHAINRLILELMKCETLSSISKQILQFIKDFNAPIGFSIHSELGKDEYFPGDLFNDSTIDLVKSPSTTESLIHLDEGTLFIFSKIHLMHLNIPERDGHPILETSLHGLAKAADECIKHIEVHKSSKNFAHETNLWVETVKSSLSNIDIQYASQAEENRKTFNNFIAEMRKAYPLLDLHGQGAIVLDNAINEYEERMHLLLSSSDVIDHEISSLLENMKKLKITH
jgi:hypothetical protein